MLRARRTTLRTAQQAQRPQARPVTLRTPRSSLSLHPSRRLRRLPLPAQRRRRPAFRLPGAQPFPRPHPTLHPTSPSSSPTRASTTSPSTRRSISACPWTATALQAVSPACQVLLPDSEWAHPSSVVHSAATSLRHSIRLALRRTERRACCRTRCSTSRAGRTLRMRSACRAREGWADRRRCRRVKTVLMWIMRRRRLMSPEGVASRLPGFAIPIVPLRSSFRVTRAWL